MRALTLLSLALAAVPPALGQVCPDGTPPPCRASPRRAAPLPAPGSRQRPFTIVAEFDGTASVDVRAAAKNLVASALDESSVLAVLPEDQIRLGLTLAGKPETTRVDAAAARELAVRGAVRTVITGTIDQVGQTYHAAVRVLDADSNTVVAARRQIARGEDELILALDRAVRAVRTDLGERRVAIAANRSLDRAATQSFAAYQRYRRAGELNMGGDYVAAIAAYKEALALDSEFAAAWRGLSAAYSNLGFGDSGLSAVNKALARPDRLTESQRLLAEGLRAGHLGDLSASVAALEQAHRLSGESPSNLSNSLSALGRDSEAAALLEEWEQRTPFGLRPIERNNLIVSLLALGRFSEARRRAASLSGDLGTNARLRVAAWTAEWPAADSLAKRLLEQTKNRRLRMQALLAQASVAAARGRVREALGIMVSCQCEFQELVLRMASGSPVTGAQRRTSPADTTINGQWLAALWAAASGDTAAARPFLTRVQGLPPEQRRGWDADATYVTALLAPAEGRPADLVRLLRPLADGRASGAPVYAQAAQWSLAAAYERQGQLDSAAAQLERLAAWQGSRGGGGSMRGLTHSFAHQRLILLYARLGRIEDARRYWQVFSTTFTQPDPEMQHIVDEARAALAEAERQD